MMSQSILGSFSKSADEGKKQENVESVWSEETV